MSCADNSDPSAFRDVSTRRDLPNSETAAERTIPQRELRNNISAVLRAAETFTVTVRGHAVARVVPPGVLLK